MTAELDLGSWPHASRRTSSCSTPTSTRRSAVGWWRWRRRTPTGWAGAPSRRRPSGRSCLITYGDGIRRADETPLHTLVGVPPRPRRRPGQRRAPAADVPVDLRRRVRGRRPPRGQHRARHLGRRGRAGRRARPDVRLRGQPHLEQQPLVHRLARRRPGVRGVLRRARPGLRRLARDPAAHHAAVPRLPAAGRHDRRGVDDVRRGPGRRRRAPPRDAARADRRAARLPRARSLGRAARRHRLPLEGVGHHLHPPAADARGDQAVAGAGRPRRAGRAAADRDQRAARGEHLLLRQRRGRGPPRLPVRAAAAGAALVRGRRRRRGSATGRRASAR